MKLKIDKKTRVLLGIFVVMILLGCWRNLRTGISLGQQYLFEKSEGHYENKSSSIIMDKGTEATYFQMVINMKVMHANLVWSEVETEHQIKQEYATITFDDGNVVEGMWFSDMLVDMDYRPLGFGDIGVMYLAGEEIPISDITLSHVLCRLDLGMTSQNGTGYLIVSGAFIYVIGALCFLYPNKMYFMGSRWMFKNPELSSDGEMMQRFGGILTMIVGFAIAVNIFEVIQ